MNFTSCQKLILLCFFLLSSCTPPLKLRRSSTTPDLLALAKIPSDFDKKVQFGGISGLTWSYDGKLLAISDDKGNISPPRFYELDLEINEESKSIHLKKVKAVFLKTENFPHDFFDFEAIYPFEDGYLISSEGNIKQNIPPALYKISKSGDYLRSFPLPLDLETARLQHNSAFEAMCTRQGDIFMISERLLKGEDSLRFYHYDSAAKKWGRLSYYFNADGGRNGVVELVCTKSGEIYSLERAFSFPKSYLIKLFKLHISKEKLKKEVVTDISNLQEVSEEGLDNFEAIVNYPRGQAKKFLVMSDNNFSKIQKNLIFYIKTQ